MKTHEILKLYFERKKLANPSYSLRALARDLDVSPAYVSTILNGKKKLPESRILSFVKVLDLDSIAMIQLKDSLYSKEKRDGGVTLKDTEFINKYKPLDKTRYEVLGDWYNIAILDLTTCKDFDPDSSWIAKRLGISKLEVEISLNNLKRLGMLIEKSGVLVKRDRKLRYPTSISQNVVRQFHMQMIKKAYEEISSKKGEEAFLKRFVAGTTFALKLDKVPLLKDKIQKLLYEVASEASEKDCEEVYQFNVQLFPLTNN